MKIFIQDYFVIVKVNSFENLDQMKISIQDYFVIVRVNSFENLNQKLTSTKSNFAVITMNCSLKSPDQKMISIEL